MANYITEALKTESLDNFKVTNIRLLHACLGIQSELFELFSGDEDDRVNMIEEVGDVLWYCAVAADELGIDFDDLRMLGCDIDHPQEMWIHLSQLNDVIKRGFFYGVELDKVGFASAVGSVLLMLDVIADEGDFTIADAKARNIAKLKVRYGDKFTTEKAVNRDLDTERDVLSGSQV